jgi:hypothetical protein
MVQRLWFAGNPDLVVSGDIAVAHQDAKTLSTSHRNKKGDRLIAFFISLFSVFIT